MTSTSLSDVSLCKIQLPAAVLDLIQSNMLLNRSEGVSLQLGDLVYAELSLKSVDSCRVI